MKYEMRQTREGATEIVDVLPERQGKDGFAGLLASVRWAMALLWFMRTLAWVWLAKGLFNWAAILGAIPRIDDFGVMPLGLQGAFVFFAVADLLAAVGLWLAAPWGGVLWLICAGSEALAPLQAATAGLVSALGVGVNLALMALYFALGWLAARERD